MKMIFSNIKLIDLTKNETSRSAVKKATEHIISLLHTIDTLTVDLQDINLTPSIADEIFGKIAAHLGANSFKNKIKIINATTTQMILIKHVIARRIA